MECSGVNSFQRAIQLKMKIYSAKLDHLMKYFLLQDTVLRSLNDLYNYNGLLTNLTHTRINHIIVRHFQVHLNSNFFQK